MEVTIPTPHLDEISIDKWFTTNYNVNQNKDIKNLIENHVWVTANRRKMYVKSMAIGHIKSCIRCFNGQGKTHIPPHYLGGKDKWLKIFQEELISRQ